MARYHKATPEVSPKGFDSKGLEIFRLAIREQSELKRMEWTRHWETCSSDRHEAHHAPCKAKCEAFVEVLKIMYPGWDVKQEVEDAGLSDALEYTEFAR